MPSLQMASLLCANCRYGGAPVVSPSLLLSPLGRWSDLPRRRHLAQPEAQTVVGGEPRWKDLRDPAPSEALRSIFFVGVLSESALDKYSIVFTVDLQVPVTRMGALIRAPQS